MEERLLLEILKTLERGNSCGRDTVKNEVLSMQSFNLMTDAEYIAAWDKLIENKCIIDFRNQQKNNVREYKLNPTKDCISVYNEKITQLQEAAKPKIEKPKWKTFDFWVEETLKYWHRLALAAVGTFLLWWLGCNNGMGKLLNKKVEVPPSVQVDTTNKKDTVSH